MKIPLIENVLKLNDEVAALNRADLKDAGVTTIDLIGGVGCGKTALLESTIQALGPDVRCAVIVGDLATARDAQRLARYTDRVVQINTGKGCHLEANHVRQALSQLDLCSIDYLFIENVGNLICPVGFDLGQDAKVGVFCCASGDEKAAKHPYIIKESAAIVLAKSDLLPHVPFNLEFFEEDVRRLNVDVPILQLSAKTNQGMQDWLNWLNTLKVTTTPVAAI